MRYILLTFFLLSVTVVSILGLRGCKSTRPPLEIFPDMDRQPRYKPQAENDFFPDRRNDRPVIAGTVPFVTDNQKCYPFTAPKDAFSENIYLTTGKNEEGIFDTGFPIPVTRQLMDRGQEQYQIFCVACHGITGDSNGITKNYGMVGVPSFHQDRFREMPEGEIYNTIRYGKNTMGAYGSKISVEDRWAIIAYVRALQLANNASIEDVPLEKRKDLE